MDYSGSSNSYVVRFTMSFGASLEGGMIEFGESSIQSVGAE
jgi:hypothetical protein